MLIKNLEYLELTNNTQGVHGGDELIFSGSTTSLSGVYRGDGYVSGSVGSHANADLGGRYCYYGCDYYEPRANSGSSGYVRS